MAKVSCDEDWAESSEFGMNRKALLSELAAFRPGSGREAVMVRRTRRFIESYADCFERSQQLGHVTGSAWVIDLGREYVLLTHHMKLDRWLQLGGHADGDPDVLAVALREAMEETGLDTIRPLSRSIFDVDVHSIPSRDGEPAHFHYDIRFVFEAERTLPLRKSAESKALSWVKLSEVSRLTREESVMRMVVKTMRLLEGRD
jgi:8-oxo-dGTP pyrophosphatase MutT (NUDIX family)